MKDLERIQELIESEIKPLTSKQDISPAELKNLGEAVDILKDVETIKAMREAGEDYSYSRDAYSRGRGYSYAEDGHSEYYPMYRRSHDGMSRGDHSMEGHSMADHSMRGSYDGRAGRDGDSDGQYSERRGRDAMGRFTSRDGASMMSRDANGYSGHSERQYMIDRLEDMADDARTERERQIIERCIAKLER